MARIWVDDDEPRDTHPLSCAIWAAEDGPCSCAHRRYKPLSTADLLDLIFPFPVPIDLNGEAS